VRKELPPRKPEILEARSAARLANGIQILIDSITYRYQVDVVLKHRETASQSTVAEASRPAREIAKKIKDQTRKPQGRLKKKADRPRKYVNWLTPFAWSAITTAQTKVGWGYTAIIKELQRSNYDFYQHLSVTTVREWVETVGGFKQWKPKVVARATRGNIPGHNKGGRRGILVKKFGQFISHG
jgi:hypothetical protein